MKDILVLITSAFPFQKGEEFLSDEIQFYTVFNKIYVIPVMVTDFSHQKRIVENMEIIKLSTIASDKMVDKALGCVKALRYFDTCDDIKYLYHNRKVSFAALRQLLVDGYKVHSISDEIKGVIKKIVNNYGENRVLIYSYWMGIHAKVASDIKQIYRDIKIVTRCHGGDLYEYRYKSNYIPFRKTIFENEDTIFTISKNGRQYLEQTYNTIKAPVIVSRLGTSQKLERSIINNEGGINIVSCSYCIPLKRIELIIEALAGIKDEGITWTHIGNGSEYEKLKQLAAERIPENIQYNFMGYIQNSKVQELYSTGQFNLFVNVSETEGIPVSIMEAMSYGIPVVATDVGGVAEMVEEGENGFLLPKDFTIDQLRSIIVNLRNMNVKDYGSMSEKSHEIWKDRFNAKKNYTEFVNILKEL